MDSLPPLTINAAADVLGAWLPHTIKRLSAGEMLVLGGGKRYPPDSIRGMLAPVVPAGPHVLRFSGYLTSEPNHKALALALVPLGTERAVLEIECLDEAAAGYVDQLVAALRTTWPDSVSSMPPVVADDLPDGLSERDKEIIRLWGQGKTAVEIATHFDRSKKTIHNRISELRDRYPDLLPHRIG